MYRVTHKEWDFNDGLKLFKIVLRMNQGLRVKIWSSNIEWSDLGKKETMWETLHFIF